VINTFHSLITKEERIDLVRDTWWHVTSEKTGRWTGEVPVEVEISFDGGEDVGKFYAITKNVPTDKAVLKFNRGDWGGEGRTDREPFKIPLVVGYAWEPAPATDLSNIFLNFYSEAIERDLV
jgi:hypothetical protein